MKIQMFILMLIAGILFTCSHSMLAVCAQPNSDAYFSSMTVTRGTGDVKRICGGRAVVYRGQLLYLLADEFSTANTSLTLTMPSKPQWNDCTMEATLKDESENPLSNFDIDIYVCGTGCMDWISTAKTDLNGVASLKYPCLRAGTYNVTAIFGGTTNYAQSSSEQVSIIIIDYTPHLIGGIITVAVIRVVGYIVFRRRKKAIPS